MPMLWNDGFCCNFVVSMRNDRGLRRLRGLRDNSYYQPFKIRNVMDEKINILGGNQDTATAMAMMNNNPWMYLVMLALFGGGGFGFGNRGAGVAANGVLDMETQNKLNSLQGQINDNNNNQWAREAITGVGARADLAISQLAQNLGVGIGELRGAIGGVKDAIFNLGAQNGMGFQGVTNAINLGQLNIIQQLSSCCCELKQLTITKGFENQIRTLQQTTDLKDSQRVENGLTRAEIAAFRQAWENSRYQDAVAEKTRLQTELDLLRSQQADTARYNTLQAEMQKIEWEMQQFFNTYGGSSKVAQQSAR